MTATHTVQRPKATSLAHLLPFDEVVRLIDDGPVAGALDRDLCDLALAAVMEEPGRLL